MVLLVQLLMRDLLRMRTRRRRRREMRVQVRVARRERQSRRRLVFVRRQVDARLWRSGASVRRAAAGRELERRLELPDRVAAPIG